MEISVEKFPEDKVIGGNFVASGKRLQNFV